LGPATIPLKMTMVVIGGLLFIALLVKQKFKNGV
jgi:ABC-type enterochelin transport system permease subunit